MRFYTILLLFLTGINPSLSQTTTAAIDGSVKNNKEEPVSAAAMILTFLPTAAAYSANTDKAGLFVFNNLLPGGPYLLEISHIGFEKETIKDLFLRLGENRTIDISLVPSYNTLKEISVTAPVKKTADAFSNGWQLNREMMENIPSAGRNLFDYLRVAPAANVSTVHEGASSFAGQNNRYNAFYIDGAVNNDVFGLTASGTNGGQAGVSPISIESIDQFQAVTSPYDVSLGGFTGGSIQAITKSGNNHFTGTVYRYFSNEWLNGTRLKTSGQSHSFSTQSSGMSLQGPVSKNHLFYFLNMELQRNQYPKPFSITDYSGYTSHAATLDILRNTLINTYQYDPGDYRENTENIDADRLVLRFDWNVGNKSKISFSNRYTKALRTNTYAGNSNTINFRNNGFFLASVTNSASLEWKTVTGNNQGNRLLLTLTTVSDRRSAMGKPFPRVRINDGEGAIIFGTDNSSANNRLGQKNMALFDRFSYLAGKHLLHIGVDGELNFADNQFIQNSFGYYSFSSIGNFLRNEHPSGYQLGFILPDTTDHRQQNGARFSILKAAVFISDEIRVSRKLMLQAGVRADRYFFLRAPDADPMINHIAIPAFTQYWDTKNTVAGNAPVVPLSISPRIGFVFHWLETDTRISGGLGLFSGRIPLAWPAGIYQYNGLFAGGYTANINELNNIRFRADPYKQWTTAETGGRINNTVINLASARLKMPAVLRASVQIDKSFTENSSCYMKTVFTKNMSEIAYTNINLLPATANADGPDNRMIYPVNNMGRIPLLPDGSNPYDYVILLHNNDGQKGYAGNITMGLLFKQMRGWNLQLHYAYGRSMSVHDGTASINVSQWRFTETVNGRNFPALSVSDFSMGHKVSLLAYKTIVSPDKKRRFTVSVSYTGQSGSPFSYVYGDGSLTRDDGPFGNYDLLYVPTREETGKMIFLKNNINGTVYTSEMQQKAFNQYIETDSYLNTRRGQYTERNGNRTPFTNRVDLGLKKTFRFLISGTPYELILSLDISNLLNLFNPGWGKQYSVLYGNFPLLGFAGYTGSGNNLPQYRFNPELLGRMPWTTLENPIPAYSSTWTAQLGFRLRFF
jgi:hypothetical protein